MARSTSFKRMLQKYCGDYCTKNPNEAFAETLAIYYGCKKSRELLTSSPEVVAFIKKIEAFEL